MACITPSLEQLHHEVEPVIRALQKDLNGSSLYGVVMMERSAHASLSSTVSSPHWPHFKIKSAAEKKLVFILYNEEVRVMMTAKKQGARPGFEPGASPKSGMEPERRIIPLDHRACEN